MSRRDTTPFRKTRLALTVAALCASLGACSSLPREEGTGGARADAGRETSERGSGLWDRTLYLLGFGGEAADDAGDTRDRQLLDEVDLALMEEDAVMPSPNAVDVVRSSAWADTATGDEGDAVADGVDDPLDGERVLVENAVDGEPLPASTSDLTHEVGESETLWDIARMTTGDATNWHVLADVNDLAPDAAVYPGQTLVVPADMVRPELAGFTTTAEASEASEPGTAAGSLDEDVVADAGDQPSIPGANGAPEASAEVGEADVLAAAGETGGTELQLGAGETLWDFAKRTTGDATNWQAIADANGFSEEQATKVRENQRITVPTALLKEEIAAAGADETLDTPETGETLDVAEAEEAPDTAGTGETLDVADAGNAGASGAEAGSGVAPRDELVPIADAADVASDAAEAATGDDASRLAADGSAGAIGEDAAGSDADEPIRIVEAAFRAESDDLADDAAATSAAAGAEATAAANAAVDAVSGAAPQEIMVSGTYYPKAVYNDADFSSSLLMRVSPGTTLQVSRAVGSWYEVATEQGTGYVHARDIK